LFIDPRRCLLIDGRSGSGKTELAAAIAVRFATVQTLHLDDIYPGWSGLAAASAALPAVLESGRWRSWDWSTGAPGPTFELDPTRPLVVEGVGAISRASLPYAQTAIWVQLGAPERRRRALGREPEFAAHWRDWAAQERAHIASEHPARLATFVVDGSDVLEAARCLEWSP
jgi:energy-coupling factor transporter ATP-binding protein EcfA2